MEYSSGNQKVDGAVIYDLTQKGANRHKTDQAGLRRGFGRINARGQT